MPGVQAYCQLNAATTVTMPYGIRIEVRTVPRPKIVRCITIASAMPSDELDGDRDDRDDHRVTQKASHQYGDVSTAP